MTSLLEKFRNTRFPNWMRQIKASEPEEFFRAANDNDINSMAMDAGKFILSDELKKTYIENLLYSREKIRLSSQRYAVFVRKETLPPNVIASVKFKLKMPVSLKRRLCRNKQNYQKVREWIDEMEKSINQAFEECNSDER